jgi:DNA-binding NarL/FixJ family response regulator
MTEHQTDRTIVLEAADRLAASGDAAALAELAKAISDRARRMSRSSSVRGMGRVRAKPGLTEAEAATIIERYSRGETAKAIALDVGRAPDTVQKLVKLGWPGWCARRAAASAHERRKRRPDSEAV